ncbi:MAG: PEP-CTERM system TPR-repeat protein PrsT [Propionivibrio sp.]
MIATIVLVGAVITGACSPSSSDAMREGKAFIEKGDLASAVIAFKNAVQAEPNAPEARAALGNALELSGDLTGAEQQYRRAVEFGSDANVYVPKIAVILLDRSDLISLIRDFGLKKLTHPAANSDLRGILAVAHVTLGEKPKALAELAKATVDTPAVRLARAQVALVEGRDQDAINELERVLQEKNPPWWVLRAVGRVYWARGNSDKALVAMKAASDGAGSHPDVIGEYAEKLFRSGRGVEAKPLIERLRKIAPRHYRTAVLDALGYMESGKFEEAYISAARVLAALPDHLPSLLIAAKVELDRGELSSAEQHIRRILALNPQLVEALRMRFMLELRRGNTKSAAETLEKALKLAPKDRGLLAAAADLAWAKGDKTGAVKQLTLAAQMQPPQPRMLARLAEMKNQMGKRDEARTTIDQAITLSEKDPQSREDVLRATMRMRFLDKAKVMARKEIDRRPKDPEPLMWMAGVLGSEGDAKGAFEHTRLALDVRADYYPALFALARMSDSPERMQEYDERLLKAIQSGSKDARVYLDRVRSLRLSGAELEQIGAVFEQGLRVDPLSADLRTAAVQHLLALGRKDKALALASEGEAAQPDSVAMIALVATSNEATGNYEQAVKKYGLLTARFPDRIDWATTYAMSLAHAGRSSEAITFLRKLIASRADEPAPYRTLAMLQIDAKQEDAALTTAAMLRDRPKLRISGFLLLGDVYAKVGKRDEAIKAYAEVGKAGENDVARVRKIELLDRLDASAYAGGELNTWLASSPNNIAALSLAARRASAKGDYATAAGCLERIVRLEPQNPIALNDLAWSYAQIRNPEALAVAKKALELAPENPEVLDTLAEAQAVAGLKDEAVGSLRRALAIAPGLPGVRIHLAELLIAKGSKKEASGLLEGIQEKKLNQDMQKRFRGLKENLG